VSESLGCSPEFLMLSIFDGRFRFVHVISIDSAFLVFGFDHFNLEFSALSIEVLLLYEVKIEARKNKGTRQLM